MDVYFNKEFEGSRESLENLKKVDLYFDEHDDEMLKMGSALTYPCENFGGLWLLIRSSEEENMVAELSEVRTKLGERVFNIEVSGDDRVYPLNCSEKGIEFSANLI